MGACASSVPEPVAPIAEARQTRSTQREQTQPASRREQQQPASFTAAVVGWDKNFAPLTASALLQNRTVFWDTHSSGSYGGKPDMWAALRLACEALLVSNDEETAGVILDSASMQPLQTDEPENAFTYDRLGFKYVVPLYCIFTPSNMLRDAPNAAAAGKVQVVVAPLSARAAAASASPAAAGEGGEPADSAAAAASSPAASGKSLRFKVRFSNGMADLPLDERGGLTIGGLKALIVAKYPNINEKRCRIMYLGKALSNDAWSLTDVGLKKEMVIQCFCPNDLNAAAAAKA